MNIFLLVLRIIVGALLPLFASFYSGFSVWNQMNENLKFLGIEYASEWILLASFSQFVVSILIVLGIYFKFAVSYMIVSVLFTIFSNLVLVSQDSDPTYKIIVSLLFQLLIFVLFLFMGPGKYRFLLKNLKRKTL